MKQTLLVLALLAAVVLAAGPSSFIAEPSQGVYKHFGGQTVKSQSFDLLFSAQAAAGIHVSFMCAQAGQSNEAYEVLIGGFRNTRAVIRDGTGANSKEVAARRGAQADNTKMVAYMISYDDGVLMAWSEIDDDSEPALAAKMPQLPCDRVQIGFAAWNSPVSIAAIQYEDVLNYVAPGQKADVSRMVTLRKAAATRRAAVLRQKLTVVKKVTAQRIKTVSHQAQRSAAESAAAKAAGAAGDAAMARVMAAAAKSQAASDQGGDAGAQAAEARRRAKAARDAAAKAALAGEDADALAKRLRDAAAKAASDAAAAAAAADAARRKAAANEAERKRLAAEAAANEAAARMAAAMSGNSLKNAQGAARAAADANELVREALNKARKHAANAKQQSVAAKKNVRQAENKLDDLEDEVRTAKAAWGYAKKDAIVTRAVANEAAKSTVIRHKELIAAIARHNAAKSAHKISSGQSLEAHKSAMEAARFAAQATANAKKSAAALKQAEDAVRKAAKNVAAFVETTAEAQDE